MPAPLLELRGLRVAFPAVAGEMVAVDGVDLRLERGEMVALVGESGCGKSLTASALIGLPPPAARVRAEAYRFDGRDIDLADEASVRALRGKGIGMVFQDPLAALDPVETIGAQLVETLRAHSDLSRAGAVARAVELLAEAGLPDPAQRMGMHPHELSGGQRQRATLALALAADPKLLIADEPTTALDPTLRLALVAHLERLRRERGLSILFVTHDLALVAQAAETIAVMYCGRIVEKGSRAAVLGSPAHPYTVGLVGSAPELGVHRERLPTIPGVVPPLGRWPSGCTFAPRCEHATQACRASAPASRPYRGREVACVHPRGDAGEATA